MTVSQTRSHAILDGYTAVTEEVALLNAAPTPTTSWASLSRVDYGAYSDVTTTIGTTFGAAASGARQNAQEITFPQATTAATQNATHVAIRKQASEEYSYAALNTARPIGIGETPKFSVGNFIHQQT